MASKLRIDLARWNCRSFRITTEATLPEDIISFLGYTSKSGRFKVFYERYARSNTEHYMTLRISRRFRQQSLFAIRFIFDALDPNNPRSITGIPTSTTKASDIFLHLCNLETDLLLRCDCLFSYAREDKKVPFFLPVEVDWELFDEMRGVRLVKLENERILWENSLNLVDKNTLTHRVKFATDAKCSLDLPQKLLRRARDISRKT